MSDLWRLRRRGRNTTDRRAELARVPERPRGIGRIQPLLDRARAAGIAVEELDEEHVRLSYDARERDQWLVTEDIYEALTGQASLEGDGRTEAAPDNLDLLRGHAGRGPRCGHLWITREKPATDAW